MGRILGTADFCWAQGFLLVGRLKGRLLACKPHIPVNVRVIERNKITRGKDNSKRVSKKIWLGPSGGGGQDGMYGPGKKSGIIGLRANLGGQIPREGKQHTGHPSSNKPIYFAEGSGAFLD